MDMFWPVCSERSRNWLPNLDLDGLKGISSFFPFARSAESSRISSRTAFDAAPPKGRVSLSATKSRENGALKLDIHGVFMLEGLSSGKEEGAAGSAVAVPFRKFRGISRSNFHLK